MSTSQRRRRALKPRQHELDLRCSSWGGARKGAGRKPSRHPNVPHRARPEVDTRHPQHVTLRVARGVGNLRRKACFAVVNGALRRAREHLGVRLVHFSVQADHLHLIVEATDRDALMRALKGLSIRLARSINRVAGRTGTVFADRYHFRALTTPREVRNAIAYVLLNARKHAAQLGRVLPRAWIDPCSSAEAFDGWKARKASALDTVVPATTWLLSRGWRRHGLLGTDQVPGPS